MFTGDRLWCVGNESFFTARCRHRKAPVENFWQSTDLQYGKVTAYPRRVNLPRIYGRKWCGSSLESGFTGAQTAVFRGYRWLPSVITPITIHYDDAAYQ